MLNETNTQKNHQPNHEKNNVESTFIENSHPENSHPEKTNQKHKYWLDGWKFLEKFNLTTKYGILSIVIGTLPVLTIGCLGYYFGRKLITKQVIDSQETKAISLSNAVKNLIINSYEDMELISHLAIEKNNNILGKKQKIYDNISIFDLNGNLIKSVGESSGIEQKSMLLSDVIKNVIENKNPVITAPEIVENIGSVIYLIAPIKDENNNIVNIGKTRIPVNNLQQSLTGYIDNSKKYALLDNLGKIISSSQNDLLGKEAQTIYPKLSQIIPNNNNTTSNNKTIATFTTFGQNSQNSELVSYVPLTTNLSNDVLKMNLGLIVTEDGNIALKSQRELLIFIIMVTPLIALCITLVVAWLMQLITIEVLEKSRIQLEENHKLTNNYHNYENYHSEKNSTQDSGEIINHLNHDLQLVINQINVSIEKLKTTSLLEREEITKNIENCADISDYIHQNMQFIFDSLESVMRMINDVDKIGNLGNTRGKVVASVNHNVEIAETLEKTAKKVEYLGEYSQQIARMVSLISEIAMQTNLLAINAGIEAARFGEDGEGFAIVAEEMGELAVRNASATQEIEEILVKVQREISEVLEVVTVKSEQLVDDNLMMNDGENGLNSLDSLDKILEIVHQLDRVIQSIFNTKTSQLQASQSLEETIKEMGMLSLQNEDIHESVTKTLALYENLKATVDDFHSN